MQKEVKEETWRDVVYADGYQVSDLGRVRSIDRIISYKGGWSSNKIGRILISNYYRGGYLHTSLGSLHSNKKIHRLVAEAFLFNTNNYPEVNHINMIKDDNRLCNLEWCSRQYNLEQAREYHDGCFYKGKAIIGTKGDIILEFTNSIDAGKSGFNPSAIRNCLNGISKTHQGFVWCHDVKSKGEKELRKKSK